MKLSHLPLGISTALVVFASFVFSTLPAPAQVFYEDWRAEFDWENPSESAPAAIAGAGGCSNLTRYAFGLPGGSAARRAVSAEDFLKLPAMIKDENGAPAFSFRRNWNLADVAFLPETSTDLKIWTRVPEARVFAVPDDVAGVERCIIFPDTNLKAQFFRVRAAYADGGGFIDSDGDGIPDFYEHQLGSNPFDVGDADTDPAGTGLTFRERYDAITGGGNQEQSLENSGELRLRLLTPSL